MLVNSPQGCVGTANTTALWGSARRRAAAALHPLESIPRATAASGAAPSAAGERLSGLEAFILERVVFKV